jgi:hypothetical protein
MRRYPLLAILLAGIVSLHSVTPQTAWAETPEGFVPLFNGKDLTGWVGDTGGYKAEDALLVCNEGGHLFTEKEYSNFIVRFEFKLPPGGNNGLGIRAPLEGEAAFTAMEIQILDDSAEKYKEIHDYQYHGSIYGVVPAKRGALKPVGEWNSQEVAADGKHVKVTLNGTVIVDADLEEAAARGPLDGRDHSGLLREKGHIGFMGHGDRVEFKNIFIREMD